MDILISLLIPTLGQREIEFTRLLDSLVIQTYKNIEIVVISQDNHMIVANQCEKYKDCLDIKHLTSDVRGLSLARNVGLGRATGDIIVLSDDDCWYPANAMQSIIEGFTSRPETDILLTQIYDPISNSLYKKYEKDMKKLDKVIDLLSRSSIELAFRKNDVIFFDEVFGLGAMYVAGEENDYLIQCLKSHKKIIYKPVITVYHEKKTQRETPAQLRAKGAFYAKHFGFFIANLVLLRDLIKKRQNNYREFWDGYFKYKKNNRTH